MKVYVENNYQQMCVHAARDIAEYIKKTPDSLLCLAAGDTPTGIYRELARLQKEENLKLDACSFIGLDEWVGLSRTEKRRFFLF